MRATCFMDRVDAGGQLGRALERYRGQDVLVLGIPRGGVPVAAEVARALDADLDVVVARKLGAPGQPELAIGAVTASGERFLNAEAARELGVSEEYLRSVTVKECAEARRREERFRGTRKAAPVQGRIVIVVDDGLATGATMRAALCSVRQRQPARLIVAVPVGSREAVDALRHVADEVVYLLSPAAFLAIGEFYQHFEPTLDEEVTSLLREARSRLAEAHPSFAP